MKRRNFVPLAPGTGSIWGGWNKPIEQLASQLEADIAGLKARVEHPVRPGVPAAYRTHKVFQPEVNAPFLMDTDQDGVSSNLVNYVMRDGNTYDIPLIMPGPGVFVARQIKATIYQRLFVPAYSEPLQLHYTTNVLSFRTPAAGTKFSLYPVQPQYLGLHGASGMFNAVNFFWNMIDTRSGRRLASDLMSHQFLLPRSTRRFVPAPSDTFELPDGGYFDLHVPWVFERDGQVNFLFRPITPVIQFDSSIAGTDPAIALPYDDREQGVRNQAVTVSLELLGYRFETDQDMMKSGILSRPARY